ncbi:MAG: esterase-like activity of phytase family protein [Dermatophilus congolensis]|nr:esterase-like activity of phytase family protein [Dermatophilus congolensis]
MPRRTLACAAALALSFGAFTPALASAAPAGKGAGEPVLTSRSILPAETYTPASEKSGYWTEGNEQIQAPYKGQPVQGFSATHRLADGSYLVMSDNGFGNKKNSADALLAVHRIRPTAGADGKPGATKFINTVFTLSDPDNLVPWQIWRDGICESTPAADLPKGYTCPTTDRLLTGADFDLESMQVAPDGTFWFGEEFGPYLLHTDQQGRLLQAPIPTPGVKSPSNPTLRAGEKANLPDSKGFEGMAMSPDGRTLYPMLEGSTQEDKDAGKASDLRIYTATITKNGARFTGEYKRYRMDDPANAIGDFIAVNSTQFLVIERDSKQGAEATYKKVFLVDTAKVKPGGYVAKKLVVDLMNLADPKGVGGDATKEGRFSFPYFTIEDVEIIDDRTIAIMNDNNFPAMGGRGEKVVDANEYIEITLPKRLNVDKRVLPSFVQYGPANKGKGKNNTFAVIGDLPYGEAQNAKFSGWISDINKGKPRYTVHVGDTKSGSTRCDDAHYSWMKSEFDTFTMPLIYTPGDNEWTDCHRANNGGFDPLDRLAKIRSTYFSEPGTTLGSGGMKVASQAGNGVPENVRWTRDGIQFATLHVVGSNDATQPWSGLGKTEATPEQVADQLARMSNAIAQVKQTFADARARNDRAVVLFQQADMFDPTWEPKITDMSAFTELVQTITDESADYKGEVYLFDGDSHVLNVDRPLAAGSKWLGFYGIKGAANNLTRVTVDGSDNNTNWLKVTVNKGRTDVLSWKQVPFTN